MRFQAVVFDLFHTLITASNGSQSYFQYSASAPQTGVGARSHHELTRTEPLTLDSTVT